MKKYTSLFALLIIMTLLIVETVPQYHVSAQCKGPTGGLVPCPPGNPGGQDKPGPKNRKPTPVPPTPTPTKVPPVIQTYPIPYLYPIPQPYGLTLYPTPVPHLVVPGKVTCYFAPCWVYELIPGDPVELLAGGGFIVFLVVLAFVFLRGRANQGGGKGPNL